MIGVIAFRVVRILLVVAALVALVFLLFQERYIYFPRRYHAEDLGRLKKAGGKEIEFKTSQGRQYAYFLPAKGGARPENIWLCFSGNGGTALDWVGYLDAIHPKDAYLLIDYPGYGQCEGKPNPSTMEENVEGAVKAFVSDSKKPFEEVRPRLRVFGHSIGAAAALMAVDKFEIERGILVAPFTSTMDVAKRVVARPLTWLLRHRYDNVARLEKIKVEKQTLKLAIFHGEQDDIVPSSMGRALATKFPGMAVYEGVEGAGHNDVLNHATAAIVKEMRK